MKNKYNRTLKKLISVQDELDQIGQEITDNFFELGIRLELEQKEQRLFQIESEVIDELVESKLREEVTNALF